MKNPTRNLKRKLLIGLLAFSMTYGLMHNLPYREARAQWDDDIDSVMEGLDSDFQFGNKEDIKQSQIKATNEQLREDIQIQKNEAMNAATATSGNIVFTISELMGPAGDSLKVTFPATIGMGITGPVLVSGLDNATVTKNINVPLGVVLNLVVQCLSPTPCDFNITINSGGTFSGLGSSTGNQMLAASSGMAVFSVIAL